MICAAILSPIVVLIRTFIQVVREIVRTVCEWVSKVITTVKEVVEKVCTWLPWPLSELCKLVTKLIEVVETVWEWVCHEVIERIIDWIEIIFEYVIYVLKWFCWIIDWIVRGPALLLCLLGIESPAFLGVCIKVLADNAGNPAIPLATIQAMLREAAAIYRRCNINLVVCSFEIVRKPEFLDSTTCEFSGIFSRFFTWFAANTCGCCSRATIYFVRDIAHASGCAYPGSDWVTVDAGGDGTTIVQEIGHLADLWSHSSDPNNVMTDQPGGTHDQITHFQCCMIRTSRFVQATPPCGLPRVRSADLNEILENSLGLPSNINKGGTLTNSQIREP
jgi:hypothetical protein